MGKVWWGIFGLLVLSAVGWGAEATREVSIIARQYDFLPQKIVLVKGIPVKLYLTSLDVDHGIYIGKFNINAKIEKGKLTMVDFIPQETGKYEFSCSVFCGLGHRRMKGELLVVEAATKVAPAHQDHQETGKQPQTKEIDHSEQMHHHMH